MRFKTQARFTCSTEQTERDHDLIPLGELARTRAIFRSPAGNYGKGHRVRKESPNRFNSR